jgi:folate-binding protein YgfZ
MGKEIFDGVTPAMTGLVDRTVSFEKGCYTGQELVARVHHRGAEPVRSLVRVNGTGDQEILVADEVTVSGELVGTITSSVGSHPTALGYVKRGTAVPGVANVPSGPVELGTV